jgi:hypothetical protein
MALVVFGIVVQLISAGIFVWIKRPLAQVVRR